MEITKGENANLAGMEPRLTLTPEVIGNGWYSLQIDGKHIWRFDRRELDSGLERRVAEINAELRSPAPTPPLDVEAEKRIAEIRERESKATKGPWHQGTVKGITDDCVYREDGSNVCKALLIESKDQNLDFIAHSRQDIPFLLEQISLLRRHIASPAPQGNALECNAKSLNGQEETMENVTALMLLREIVDSRFPERVKLIIRAKTWLERVAPIGGIARIMPVEAQKILADPKATPEEIDRAYAMEIQVPCDGSHLAASPAQPEKRDEWVSVEESGLPKVGHWCWVVYHGAVQRMAAQLAGKGFSCADGYEWRWADDSADPCPLEEITHWQPLPAPPQSGKEGQP